MPDAKLYTVKTSHGIVYALHNVETGEIWTERSEYGARQLARERRLSVAQALDISHEELLRLLGREAPAPRRAPEKDAAVTVETAEPEQIAPPPNPSSAAPLASTGIAVRYHWEDEEPASADEDTLIIPGAASPAVKNVFFSDGPVSDSIAPQPHITNPIPLPPQPPKSS